MNFLAHCWLADRTQTSLAGAVLGDVVRGSDLSAYPDEIALGIRLHRKVDAACDRHPAIVALREAFPHGARRYAGIVLDLAADHALVARWDALGGEPLDAFCRRCGIAMALAGNWFEHARARAPTADGFAQLLRSYGEPVGIDRAISRTATRLRDPQALIEAGRGWQQASEVLQERIEDLLQDLICRMRDTAPRMQEPSDR